MKKFNVNVRIGDNKLSFFAYGDTRDEAFQNALKMITIEGMNEIVSKEEEKELPKHTKVLCVDCMTGRLVVMPKCNDAYCDHCGTDFIMTGETSFVYATAQNIARYRKVEQKSEPKKEIKPKMASTSLMGKSVSVNDFVSRKKMPYSEPISRLPIKDYKEIEDIDNGNKYNWVMVGLDKYDRTMYCTKTKIRRSLTMGEFYGSSPVD